MKRYIVMLSLAALALVGCDKKDGGDGPGITWKYEGVKTLKVASEKGVYFHFIGPLPCTMLREDGGQEWFAQPVVGFDDYEEGYEYVITADIHRAIVPSGLEVDGLAPYRYTLKEVVSKTERDTDDISWGLPCYDMWGQGNIEWPALPDEQLTVIRTAEEFEALTGEEADEATMSVFEEQYSILLVSGTSNYGIQNVEKQLTYKGGGNYLFEIDITQTDATVREPWTVAVLVPAIPAGADIELSIDYQLQ